MLNHYKLLNNMMFLYHLQSYNDIININGVTLKLALSNINLDVYNNYKHHTIIIIMTVLWCH